MRRPIDPRICNISCDSNALDRNGTARDRLVDRFNQLCADDELTVVVAGGVRQEIQNSRTPRHVQEAILPQIYNLRPNLTYSQSVERDQVEEILRGNAQVGKHAADASHISEAVETGCGYFITHDRRILEKRGALRPVLPPSLTIVTLEEFMEIFDAYEARSL